MIGQLVGCTVNRADSNGRLQQRKIRQELPQYLFQADGSGDVYACRTRRLNQLRQERCRSLTNLELQVAKDGDGESAARSEGRASTLAAAGDRLNQRFAGCFVDALHQEPGPAIR